MAADSMSQTESLPHDLNHQLPPPRLRIELQQDNLLPRPEGKRAIDDRDRDGWSDERGSYVTRTVVVAPAEMMTILTIARRQMLETARSDLTRRLVRIRWSSCPPWIRSPRCHDAGMDIRSREIGGDELRHVLRVALAGRLNLMGVGGDHRVKITQPAMRRRGPAIPFRNRAPRDPVRNAAQFHRGVQRLSGGLAIVLIWGGYGLVALIVAAVRLIALRPVMDIGQVMGSGHAPRWCRCGAVALLIRGKRCSGRMR